MEKELVENRRSVSEKKETMEVDVIDILDTTTKRYNIKPKMGAGACLVEGCGCTGFIESEGTCFNLNSEGGTCNHLESDHF